MAHLKHSQANLLPRAWAALALLETSAARFAALDPARFTAEYVVAFRAALRAFIDQPTDAHTLRLQATLAHSVDMAMQEGRAFCRDILRRTRWDPAWDGALPESFQAEFRARGRHSAAHMLLLLGHARRGLRGLAGVSSPAGAELERYAAAAETLHGALAEAVQAHAQFRQVTRRQHTAARHAAMAAVQGFVSETMAAYALLPPAATPMARRRNLPPSAPERP